MHRLIVLASLFITMSTGAVELIVAPAHPKLNVALQDACLLLSADCKGLEAPTLIFDDTGNNAHGFYVRGSRTIFISSVCLNGMSDQVKCEAVIAHELAHYILWFARGITDHCESEALAWDVYNAFVMQKKRLDLVRENWKESYPQCVKSQPPSTSSPTP